MRCKECKTEMTEWQRSKYSEELIIKLRCDVCGYETVEVIADRPMIVKPDKEKE